MSEDMNVMVLKGQIVEVGDGEIVVGVRLHGEDRELGSGVNDRKVGYVPTEVTHESRRFGSVLVDCGSRRLGVGLRDRGVVRSENADDQMGKWRTKSREAWTARHSADPRSGDPCGDAEKVEPTELTDGPLCKVGYVPNHRELRIPAVRDDERAAGRRLYQPVIVTIEILAEDGEGA